MADLDTPASRVRAALASVFGPVTAIGDGFVAQRRACLAAGTTVHLFSQSAGTDPRAFPDGRFDIEADRKPHFGFGGGAHHYLGHFIARSDMSEALPLLARRLVGPCLDGTPEFLPDSGNTGPVTLPIAFTPAR